MPTTVITGRDIVFSIAAVNYDAQTTSVTLTNSPVIDTYQTLDGKAYKHTDDQWTLAIELLADWGVASSLFEAMWAAAETSPNTALAYSITAATGAVFTGTAFPVFPSVGGAAPGAQTDSWSMLVVGTPTENFA
jgi:S-adenosylmethionine hydrolase